MCDFSPVVQASRARCGLLVLEYFHCTKTGGEPDGCVNPTRQTRHLTLGDVPRSAAGRRGGRHGCALLPGRPVDLPLRSVCRASPRCGTPYRTGASDAHDAFAASALAALIDAARGVRKTMEFDIRIRHGTTTTHAPHSSPEVAWDTTSTRCEVARNWRLRLHCWRLTW